MKKTLDMGDWKELLKFVFENTHSSFYLDKFTTAAGYFGPVTRAHINGL